MARVTGFARFNLFVAFAFTVMADPVSSVAYALEAALHALDGELPELLLTMALVIGTIAAVSAGYHQLIGRFPRGGVEAKALAGAFGADWAFLPVGPLLVDFTLTITISCAAGASAIIAYLPELAGARVAIALALAALVAVGSAFGHRGRVVFATAALLFIGMALIVIARGLLAEPSVSAVPLVGDASLGPALLAMPLGMALATGVEAPGNATAQLVQLNDRGRRFFGRATVWLMVLIVGFLTLGLAALAIRLNVGLPPSDSTLLAEIARRATGGDAFFAGFQALSALLLLAAAASSYLAGSGLLKALALHGADGRGGLMPRRYGRINRYFAPHWGIATLLGIAVVLIVAAAGRDQEIVRFYAVAVFASFLGALVASTRLAARDAHWTAVAINVVGVAVVTFVLVLNLLRLDGLISLGASLVISTWIWRTWVARGRPGGAISVRG